MTMGRHSRKMQWETAGARGEAMEGEGVMMDLREVRWPQRVATTYSPAGVPARGPAKGPWLRPRTAGSLQCLPVVSHQ